MCKKWGIGTVVCLICYLVIGCTLPRSSVQPSENSDALKTAEILRYFHDVKSLSQEELLHLYASEEEQLFARENDQNVLKFVLLLILPDTGLQDIPRALAILDTYMSEDKYSESLKNFAYLLSHMIREMQYQEALCEVTNKELHNVVEEKEEKEKLYNNTKQKIDIILAEKKHQESLYKELHKELDKEKATVKNLRKTIEQLKTIEKSINERKQPKAPAT